MISLPHRYSGKVRELYEVDADRLLMVATDRISVFDVVLPDAIPDKGRILTALSAFFFERVADLVPHHCISVRPDDLPAAARPDADGRGMLVWRTEPLRIECIARGYLFGGAWAEYERHGTVWGRRLPAGLRRADALPEPLFTPTTKADSGHDEPLTEEGAAALVGPGRLSRIRDLTLAVYERGAAHARAAGLILADTKLEFGVRAGELLLIDEVLTPDSSRYWAADSYEPGGSPESFDKQFVRDHYLRLGWDRRPPAPPLPPDVVAQTRRRYVEVYERLTGRSFADWYGAAATPAR